MSETLLWVQIILSSSTLVTVAGGLIMIGRMLQRQDDHERRISKVEDVVFEPALGARR
jgi:hypothetical protein